MAFEDLDELVEPLALPIRGKTYVLPKVQLEDGIRLRSVLDGAPDESLTDAVVEGILLGPVAAELGADGVSDEWKTRVYMTALANFRHGRAQAEIMWKTGGDPKAVTALVESMAPNRAARRSKPTGEAGTTKQQASTSGTKKSPAK